MKRFKLKVMRSAKGKTLNAEKMNTSVICSIQEGRGCLKYFGIISIQNFKKSKKLFVFEESSLWGKPPSLRTLMDTQANKTSSTGVPEPKGKHGQEVNKIEAPHLTFKRLLASFSFMFSICLKYSTREPQTLVQQKYPVAHGGWAPSATPY